MGSNAVFFCGDINWTPLFENVRMRGRAAQVYQVRTEVFSPSEVGREEEALNVLVNELND